jgi:hypothetical protein
MTSKQVPNVYMLEWENGVPGALFLSSSNLADDFTKISFPWATNLSTFG